MIHQVGCRDGNYPRCTRTKTRDHLSLHVSILQSKQLHVCWCLYHLVEVVPFYLQSNSESFDRLKCPNLRPAFEVRSSVLLNLSFPASLPAKCFMADVEFFQWKLQMCLLLAAKPKDNDSLWSLQLRCHGTRSLQDAWNKSPTCLR